MGSRKVWTFFHDDLPYKQIIILDIIKTRLQFCTEQKEMVRQKGNGFVLFYHCEIFNQDLLYGYIFQFF